MKKPASRRVMDDGSFQKTLEVRCLMGIQESMRKSQEFLGDELSWMESMKTLVGMSGLHQYDVPHGDQANAGGPRHEPERQHQFWVEADPVPKAGSVGLVAITSSGKKQTNHHMALIVILTKGMIPSFRMWYKLSTSCSVVAWVTHFSAV